MSPNSPSPKSSRAEGESEGQQVEDVKKPVDSGGGAQDVRVGVRRTPQEQVAGPLDVRVFFNTYMIFALISPKTGKHTTIKAHLSCVQSTSWSVSLSGRKSQAT